MNSSTWRDLTDDEIIRARAAIEAVVAWFEAGRVVEASLRSALPDIATTPQHQELQRAVLFALDRGLERFFRELAKSLYQETEERRKRYAREQAGNNS